MRTTNYQNIKYGMLVEYIQESGFHAGVKVHFFNKKGVLIGNHYKFVPYDKLRKRLPNENSNRQYPKYFMKKRFSKLRQSLFKLVLNLITKAIKFSQNLMLCAFLSRNIALNRILICKFQ